MKITIELKFAPPPSIFFFSYFLGNLNVSFPRKSKFTIKSLVNKLNFIRSLNSNLIPQGIKSELKQF